MTFNILRPNSAVTCRMRATRSVGFLGTLTLFALPFPRPATGSFNDLHVRKQIPRRKIDLYG